MRAGLLRHPLTFKTKSKSKDALGQNVVTYATEATLWGSLRTISGSEYDKGKVIYGNATGEAIIRYNPDYTPSVEDVIVFDGKTFEITYVDNALFKDIYVKLQVKLKAD